MIAGFLILAIIAALSVLCAPVRISAVFDTAARPVFVFKIAGFGGLLPLVSTNGERYEGSTRKPMPAAASRSRKSTRWNITSHAPHMLREAPRLLCKVARRVKLEGVEANITFGLSDPADTGTIYGALMSVLRLVGILEQSHVTLHADFNNEVLDGRGRIAARFTPVALIAPLLSFGWTAFILPRLSGEIR